MKKSTRLYMLAAAITFGLCSTAAMARDWHGGHGGGGHPGGGGGWHGHAREARAWHDHHWHGGHPVYERGGPYYAYAPPVIVDTPPAYETEPGLNITVPLNIR